VGLLEGNDPKLKQNNSLSAHHDHDGMSGAEIWHGADDNGSGTIGVVALARAFAANGLVAVMRPDAPFSSSCSQPRNVACSVRSISPLILAPS